MRKRVLLIGIAVLTACQTYRIGPDVDGSAVRLAELRARAARGPVLMKRSNRPEWERGTILDVSADSLQWKDALGRSFSLYRADVEAVRFDRRRAAILSWTVVGLSAGALVGRSLGDDRNWWEIPEVYMGAGAGGVAGFVLGLEYGLPITYRFR